MNSSDKGNMFAPWWTMYLARIFGEKIVGYDSGMKVTMYRWRGRLWVWKVKLDTAVPSKG